MGLDILVPDKVLKLELLESLDVLKIKLPGAAISTVAKPKFEKLVKRSQLSNKLRAKTTSATQKYGFVIETLPRELVSLLFG
jgi:hypothetical protein